MDPILYNAEMEGNTGDGDFLLADYLNRDEENAYQVTPKGNTVLHVAALNGQSGFVRQVIDITPALLCCVLLRGVDVAGQAVGINKETLMRMKDDGGETALHKAVRTGCVDSVRLLVKQDPDFELPANNAGETPLYLAAESGLVNCLSVILKYCNRPTYSGPCGRTALHAAIIQKNMVVKPGGANFDSLHLLQSCTLKNLVFVQILKSSEAKRMFKWSLRHCRLGRRNFEIKWKKMQKPEDDTESRENIAKRDKKGKLKDIMEATQIHLVVATLLVTVTFAAGFTLPGDFESDLNSSNKGMAILIRLLLHCDKCNNYKKIKTYSYTLYYSSPFAALRDITYQDKATQTENIEEDTLEKILNALTTLSLKVDSMGTEIEKLKLKTNEDKLKSIAMNQLTQQCAELC
ncbi:hypothetical protein CQW23_03118 [Capsicum baccatum]|uniref:PGG domain-containing protein n=1 Tax=Capsicum baccatum TaxID=33114 RepID=A0A2G2XTE7_CAPBA|nr:hypothetical protein CQW23_03118 [Capsicum baccatum]